MVCVYPSRFLRAARIPYSHTGVQNSCARVCVCVSVSERERLVNVIGYCFRLCPDHFRSAKFHCTQRNVCFQFHLRLEFHPHFCQKAEFQSIDECQLEPIELKI